MVRWLSSATLWSLASMAGIVERFTGFGKCKGQAAVRAIHLFRPSTSHGSAMPRRSRQWLDAKVTGAAAWITGQQAGPHGRHCTMRLSSFGLVGFDIRHTRCPATAKGWVCPFLSQKSKNVPSYASPCIPRDNRDCSVLMIQRDVSMRYTNEPRPGGHSKGSAI